MGDKNPSSVKSYDDVLDHIGQFGPWQMRIFFYLWLTSAAGGLAVVVYTFTAFSTPYQCEIPQCQTKYNGSHWITMDQNKTIRTPPGQCQYYGIANRPTKDLTCDDYVSAISDNSVDKINETCGGESLVFDKTYVTSSLIQDYGFTCGEDYKKQIYGALYMLGMLFGSFGIGAISDKYGRMNALMLSIALVSGSGFLGAFMTDAHGFGFFRFLTGIGGIGCFMVTFVICVEYVGAKYTMLTGILIEVPFAIGEGILGLEAYFIRDWFTLQIVAYAPLILLLGLWFLVPESPRWLLAKGRIEAAKNIITKGAEINKKALPNDFLHQNSEQQAPSSDQVTVTKPTLLDLFRPLLIFKRIINMCYQWFSVTMCYYGLSFASVDLLGDPYTNFILSVGIEIPGYVFCVFVMDRWGRRPILSFTQIVSGVACIFAGLLTSVPSLSVLQVILSLIGKFGASACFAIVYVYTAELFPTVIRNTAVGTCSTVARIGGICAILIGLIPKPYPMVIMGIVACLAGGLAILFPETVGTTLPETMEDAINIGKDSKRGLCTCTSTSE